MRFRAISLSGLILIMMALSGLPGDAQQAQPTEYQLKAAFLFNFAKFVEWPPKAFASKTSPMVIGILGDNPFQDDLTRMIRDRSVDEHPLKVLEIKEFPSPEATNCHILFISNSQKAHLTNIIESLRGIAVLTVGEAGNFTESGGMIKFYVEQTKIRFQINQDAATKASLKISSKLMSLSSKPGG